jgi:cysteine sulfinate desulfinase/cysteine desulfurase-like protein
MLKNTLSNIARNHKKGQNVKRESILEGTFRGLNQKNYLGSLKISVSYHSTETDLDMMVEKMVKEITEQLILS